MAPSRKGGRKPKDDAPVRFEEALARLERAVADLESGELAIDDALARYEAGIGALRHCQQILKRAEQRVAELLRDSDGTLDAVPLDGPTDEGPPA